VPTAHIWLKNMTPVKIPKMTASSISSDKRIMETAGERKPAMTIQLVKYQAAQETYPFK